jgi:hypothetical protein
MKSLIISLALVLSLAVGATAGEYALSVTGSGNPGTPLNFTVKGPSDPNAVAFLGISPLPGTTVFPFVTMDLAMPIWASGMGSLNDGKVSHKVVVPKDWPPFLTLPFYAQSVVVMPKGAGHQAVTTNVVKFLVTGK